MSEQEHEREREQYRPGRDYLRSAEAAHHDAPLPRPLRQRLGLPCLAARCECRSGLSDCSGAGSTADSGSSADAQGALGSGGLTGAAAADCSPGEEAGYALGPVPEDRLTGELCRSPDGDSAQDDDVGYSPDGVRDGCGPDCVTVGCVNVGCGPDQVDVGCGPGCE
jgi:hypothetical protein